jgi:hypothetical protein
MSSAEPRTGCEDWAVQAEKGKKSGRQQGRTVAPVSRGKIWFDGSALPQRVKKRTVFDQTEEQDERGRSNKQEYRKDMRRARAEGNESELQCRIRSRLEVEVEKRKSKRYEKEEERKRASRELK